MKHHFETLGLQEGASQEAIQEAYDRLSKELNPSNNDNQDFFKEEYNKVQVAYEALYNSSILATEKGAKKNSSETKAPQVKKQNEKTPQNIKRSSKRDFVFGGFLFFITVGIWGIFLQNMGFFIPNDDFTQKVRVVNTVDTFVNGGNIKVSGDVDINNTIDVNLEAINGHYNVFYDNNGDKEYRRIPVYSFD